MMRLSLDQVAKQISATVIGEDVQFSSVSTDTRHISRGDLFVALQGPSFDGHDYVMQARERGAVATMVSRQLDDDFPQVLVDDTRLGLGRLANVWRNKVNPKVIGLTGSNGKTTLKEMLASIFSSNQCVLATEGNLNNDIGVPLTLLRLQNEKIAIVEMGANHVGEIAYLSQMSQPNIAILNNAGTAHIGEFGGEENIARAKAEIIQGLSADGVFVYHNDHQWAPLWRQLSHCVQAVNFGVSASSDYQLNLAQYQIVWEKQRFLSQFEVIEKQTNQRYLIKLALAGEHNAMNALAAIATARTLGVEVDVIQKALLNLKPVTGRLSPVVGCHGQFMIDDSYNANPDSVLAAIQVLVTAPQRRILVLGDLAELGDTEEESHRRIGEFAKKEGVDCLYTCGTLSLTTSQAFYHGQVKRHFTTQDALISALRSETVATDTLLIKGSRSAEMDRVVTALMMNEDFSVC